MAIAIIQSSNDDTYSQINKQNTEGLTAVLTCQEEDTGLWTGGEVNAATILLHRTYYVPATVLSPFSAHFH